MPDLLPFRPASHQPTRPTAYVCRRCRRTARVRGWAPVCRCGRVMLPASWVRLAERVAGR